VRRPMPIAHRLAAGLGLLALAATACGGDSSPTTTAAPSQTGPADVAPAVSYPITVTACGKPVTIPSAPKRVVVDDTAVAEMLFALGVGDKIVAQFMDPNLVDALPQYKDQDAKVASLGGPKSSRHAPSKEVLLSAQPDLVIPSFPKSIDSEGTISTADLASIGAVSVGLSYSCPNASATLKIDDQLNDVLLVGEVFGVKAKAQKLVDDMRAQLADVQRSNEAFASKPADVFVITNLTGISAGAVPPQDAFDTAAKLFPTMPAAVNHKWVTVSGHAQQPSLVAIGAVVDVAKVIHPEAF
jgi:iron complex transport system substrate-binding protein